MNESKMPEWLNDYKLSQGSIGDQDRVCWASDSGLPWKTCWCAQCVEARLVLPLWLNIEAKDAELARLQARAAEMADGIAKVEAWLEEALAGWSASNEEFRAEHYDLIQLTGFEMVENKTFTVRIEVEVEVEVPFGTDVSEYDFWINSLDVESNYQINHQDSCDITDVRES